MNWRLYRDFKNPDYNESKIIVVTCQYYNGALTVPITKRLDISLGDQTIFAIMLNEMNSKINTLPK